MYLVDTNIWLERLLDQAGSEGVGQFLQRVSNDRLYPSRESHPRASPRKAVRHENRGPVPPQASAKDKANLTNSRLQFHFFAHTRIRAAELRRDRLSFRCGSALIKVLDLA